MKRTQTFTSKPVYLSISILEISKILLFEYDYVKLCEKSKIILHGFRQLCSLH